MQEKDVGISKGDINMEEKIVKVLNVMSEYLSIAQMKKLQEVILQTFAENEAEKAEIANDKFLEMFLDAKTIEGCSERTIKYYRETVQLLYSHIRNHAFYNCFGLYLMNPAHRTFKNIILFLEPRKEA